MRGLDRQTAIYLAGVSGIRSRVPADATKLEERAREVMDRDAFEYVAGGAGTDTTVVANRPAFDRRGIVPRQPRDGSEGGTSVGLFGRPLPPPLPPAPGGGAGLARP